MAVRVQVSLSESEAMAVAQLCKRFGWDDAARLSNAFDEGNERDDMMDGVMVLSRALAEKGFAPR